MRGHRLGDGKSRVAGEDAPHCSASVRRSPRLRRGFGSEFGSTQLHRLGDGKSRVAGEDTPHCSSSVRRPPRLRRGFGSEFGSTQLHRLGDGKSRVAGEDTPPLLRERSPIPEPPVTRGALDCGVKSAAPARGRQKWRRGRGYAPDAPPAFADPLASFSPRSHSLPFRSSNYPRRVLASLNTTVFT